MMELSTLPHTGPPSASLCGEPPRALLKRTGKTLYYLIYLCNSKNQSLWVCVGREGEGRERQGVRDRLAACPEKRMVGWPHPTGDLTIFWPLHTTQRLWWHKAGSAFHLAFFASTVLQPRILTFPQCYYHTIRKRKVGRQGISKVILLKLTALQGAFEEENKPVIK